MGTLGSLEGDTKDLGDIGVGLGTLGSLEGDSKDRGHREVLGSLGTGGGFRGQYGGWVGTLEGVGDTGDTGTGTWRPGHCHRTWQRSPPLSPPRARPCPLPGDVPVPCL